MTRLMIVLLYAERYLLK